MALQDINLIPDAEGGKPTSKKTKAVLTITAAVLVLYVLVVGFVFLQNARSASALDKVRKQKEPLQKDIDSLVNTEKSLRALVLKLDAINVIYKEQPPFEKIMNRLIELAGNSVTFSEISLTAPDKVLISGIVDNLDSLEAFLGTLTAKEFGRTSFTDIVIQSLGRGDDGKYDFALRFTYIGK